MSTGQVLATVVAAPKTMPSSVMSPLLLILGWTAWLVLVAAVGRIIWAGALLWSRSHRGEAAEGLLGALIVGVIVASAAGFAAQLYAPIG